jgi:hypothetical protein
MARTFRVTDEALRQAERLGLGAAEAGGDVEAIVKDMARRASRITHPVANRRYRNFILSVTPDDVVTMVGAMSAGEASYFGQRPYDARKAAETDGLPGEAVVERTRRR